jgi:hypothetical protein
MVTVQTLAEMEQLLPLAQAEAEELLDLAAMAVTHQDKRLVLAPARMPATVVLG